MTKATFVTSNHYNNGKDIMLTGPSGSHRHVGALEFDFKNTKSHVNLIWRTMPPFIYVAVAND